MSHYRRNYVRGGTFFFTVKLADPKSHLLVEHIDLLRESYVYIQKRYPFETVAACILPNHIHAIWTLPDGDDDYSLRWKLVKRRFSDYFPHAQNRSPSKLKRHEKGIWQRRFYEQTVFDEADLRRCVAYVYFNPLKHGLVGSVREWPFSSFHRDVEKGLFPADWGGSLESAVMNFGE
ncbi:MAG: transposase [Neisseria sp.]|nr:transposase [Neisseria sp.]